MVPSAVDVVGEVERHLHDEPGGEQPAHTIASQKNARQLALVLAPGGAVAHQEADDEADQRPADERGDEQRDAVDARW